MHAGAPVPFEAFMDDALYGAHGFYTTSGTAGRRGDFITSPEVGPLFGQMVARAVLAEWRSRGEPAEFTVIEYGAGPGTLARAMMPALHAAGCAARYVAVEVSAAQRAQHPAGVTSVASMPSTWEPAVGVVIANELLDNLPFRLAVFDGGWREAFVVTDAHGRATEVLSAPFDPLPSVLPPDAPHGARAPLQHRAGQWVDEARRLLLAGRVFAIDYCTARTADLAGEPWRAWLRTYRGHQRGEHYLSGPGTQDITAQVCIDQLPEPDAVRSQSQFLQRWGVDEMVAEGRAVWQRAVTNPDLAALRMRSRITEAEALLDPAGLGGFSVLEWAAG